MTFPKEISDHHKENLTQKCYYLVNLFKAKDVTLWEKYKARLETLKPEESWDFFHELLVEYQKLGEAAVPVKAKAKKTEQKPIADKSSSPKKAPAKKAAKKVAKKAPAKKAAKKVAKKAPVKKAAKKVVKKAPAKKAAKKVVKKAPAKKSAKKTAKKTAKKK